MTGVLHIGEQTDPRFEFRLFGSNLQGIRKQLEHLSDDVPVNVKERYSEEIYLVSLHSNRFNIKIRDNNMDVKELIWTDNIVEQWNPVLKSAFPIDWNVVKTMILPGLKLLPGNVLDGNITVDRLSSFIDSYSEALAVKVSKRRFGFLIHNTICEFANVVINDTKVDTVAVESTDIEAVRATIAELGLGNRTNINYIMQIKSLAGLVT